jgi:adenylate cyclase
MRQACSGGSDGLALNDFFLRMMQHYHLALSGRDGRGDKSRELDPRCGFVAAIAGACHMLNILCGHGTERRR